MSVQVLWDELQRGGWNRLSQWRADSKSEGLHLDFKQGAFSSGDLRVDDRKNLAKGLSGFANVEGGLLIFGAETTRGPAKQDVLQALTCVAPLDQYTERIRVHIKDSTTPPVPGVDVKEFANPSVANSGVVVVRIPQSDGGPYRAEGPSAEVAGRYFMRTTSDTVVMHHQQLAAMFGRRPNPRLRLGIEEQAGKMLIHIENVGRGAATSPFVRLRINGQTPDTIHARGSWQDKKFDVLGPHGWMMAFALSAGDLVYPGESRIVATFRHTGDEREIAVRVDCQNAQPIETTRRVRLQPGVIEWFSTPDRT